MRSARPAAPLSRFRAISAIATRFAGMFGSIRERLGPPDVLLYNTGSGAFGTGTEITPEQFEASWRSMPWSIPLRSGMCTDMTLANAESCFSPARPRG